MPQHGESAAGPVNPAARDESRNRPADWKRHFALPGPIRRSFARFPLVTYPANQAPARAPRLPQKHTLYVFTTQEAADRGLPSFNPTCLKWQTYLKATGVDFSVAASNNHAAPNGSLPFLLPTSTDTKPDSSRPDDSTLTTRSSADPIAYSKLGKWLDSQDRRTGSNAAIASPLDTKINGNEPDSGSTVGIEAKRKLYASLIDDRIRRAWLCQLYMDPANFESVARRLYIDTASSSWFIRTVTAYQLQRAAAAELAKANGGHIGVDQDGIMADAERALEALSTVLGEDEWFFAVPRAGLFDASLFAYTHLLLDDKTMEWRTNRLGNALRQHDNLVRHRTRLLRLF